MTEQGVDALAKAIAAVPEKMKKQLGDVFFRTLQESAKSYEAERAYDPANDNAPTAVSSLNQKLRQNVKSDSEDFI